MTSNSKYEQLSQWISDLLDETISQADFNQLQDKIHNDPACLRYYIEFLTMWSFLKNRSATIKLPSSSLKENPTGAILEILAENEKTAHAIDALGAFEKKTLTDPNSGKPIKRFNQNDLVRFLIKMAAVLFIALGILWFDRAIINMHQTDLHVKIARITNEVNACWDYNGLQFETGEWMWSGNYRLESGFAELSFMNGTHVVLEAPIDFKLISQDSMYLDSGKLYASVPRQAIGFTVNTDNTKIIDLGTEFGIVADKSGNTDLHVIQGKTQLVARHLGDTQLVPAGKAKRINNENSAVTDIDIGKDNFVRRIDSFSGQVWRGQPRLDLSDIIAGGNGFGTGRPDSGLDPATGKLVNVIQESANTGSYEFNPVQLPFVDGVFVPDGEYGPVQIASNFLYYEGFNNTGNDYYFPICNNDRVIMVTQARGHVNARLSLDDPQTIIDPEVICMHANVGVTFDLDAIRRAYPLFRIERFTSRCGIAYESDDGSSDFYLLVDAKPMAIYRNVTKDGCVDIDVVISDTDRFLTLASLDGGHQYADWGVFENPYLWISEIPYLSNQ